MYIPCLLHVYQSAKGETGPHPPTSPRPLRLARAPKRLRKAMVQCSPRVTMSACSTPQRLGESRRTWQWLDIYYPYAPCIEYLYTYKTGTFMGNIKFISHMVKSLL